MNSYQKMKMERDEWKLKCEMTEKKFLSTERIASKIIKQLREQVKKTNAPKESA